MLKNTTKIPQLQTSESQTKCAAWSSFDERAYRSDGDAEGLIRCEWSQPTRHRGDWHDRVAREHEHEEGKNSGDLGRRWVLGPEPDCRVEPRERIAEGEDQSHPGQDRAESAWNRNPTPRPRTIIIASDSRLRLRSAKSARQERQNEPLASFEVDR